MRSRNVHEIHKKEVIEKFSVIMLYLNYEPRRYKFDIQEKIRQNLALVENKLYSYNHNVIGIFGESAWSIMPKAPTSMLRISHDKYSEYNETRAIGMGLFCSDAEKVIVVNGLEEISKESFHSDFEHSYITMGPSANKISCSLSETKDLEILMPGNSNTWSSFAFFRQKELSLLRTTCWNEDKGKLLYFETINAILNKGGNFKCK